MSIDLEYAIKKDLRNNPIVRGVDEKQRRSLWRSLGLGAAAVAMLLFSAWQHYQIIDSSYHVQRMAQEYAQEELRNRRLRLEVETLRAPALIEARAMRELRMVYPTPADTMLIERVRAVTAPADVVARVQR
ncbi:MAG: cell division protein FtsL [Acidobacteria bacterium]|nr:cell division protein FtsL [Acidobacteriota bacterium]